MDPTELLGEGLLRQFASLKSLEAMLEVLIAKQTELLEKNLQEAVNFSTMEIAEVSLMVRPPAAASSPSHSQISFR